MKALSLSLFALALMLVASVTPAHAAGGAGKAAPSGVNPSQACTANDNAVISQFAPGLDGSFPLQIPSHGGCVSTVAGHTIDLTDSGQPIVMSGDYSHAAFVAQCKLLQSALPPALWNAPVNIIPNPDDPLGPPSNVGGFGGKIETCTWLLQGYHSGTLTHPE